MATGTLKASNRYWLTSVILSNAVLFWAFWIGLEFSLLRDPGAAIGSILSPSGILVTVSPLATLLVLGLIPTAWKDRLVFWRALAGKPWKHRNIVPGTPMPFGGARRRPRGRTAVVRGFDDVPGETWQAIQEPISDWRGTRKSQTIRSANRAWDRHHGPADQQAYKREILPRLAHVTVRQLGAATGLSKTTCSQIRRGLKVPHPRHWEALRKVVEV